MSQLQFNDTTNKLGIIQACESYTSLLDAGISGQSAILKEFTRYINKANSTIWSWIFEAYGGWQYDDGNQTDLPSSTDTLTANKTAYALPTGSYSVRGIEIKDTGGSWTELFPMTEERIKQISAEGQFLNVSSVPRYYTLVGQTVKIFPAANYTQAASFKVFYDRGTVAFASTDTTATPGFIADFHDAVPCGASLEWLKVQKPDSSTTTRLINDWADFEKRIKSYYSQKFKEMFPPRITVRDATREAQ